MRQILLLSSSSQDVLYREAGRSKLTSWTAAESVLLLEGEK